MDHLAEQIVTQVGIFAYLIVFLGVGIESMGVPVPGETVLVIGAAIAGQGRLSVAGVAACGLAGAVTGDNIGYWVGRRWGRRLTTWPGVRRIYDERRLAVADRFFARRGWLAVFFGRFVALLRIFAGPLAGMHHMSWPHFFAANAAGGVIWVAAVTTVGVLVGSNLGRAVSIVSRAGYGGLALALVIGALLLVRHRLHVRREQREGASLLTGDTAAARKPD